MTKAGRNCKRPLKTTKENTEEMQEVTMLLKSELSTIFTSKEQRLALTTFLCEKTFMLHSPTGFGKSLTEHCCAWWLTTWRWHRSPLAPVGAVATLGPNEILYFIHFLHFNLLEFWFCCFLNQLYHQSVQSMQRSVFLGFQMAFGPQVVFACIYAFPATLGCQNLQNNISSDT